MPELTDEERVGRNANIEKSRATEGGHTVMYEGGSQINYADPVGAALPYGDLETASEALEESNRYLALVAQQAELEDTVTSRLDSADFVGAAVKVDPTGRYADRDLTRLMAKYPGAKGAAVDKVLGMLGDRRDTYLKATGIGADEYEPESPERIAYDKEYARHGDARVAHSRAKKVGVGEEAVQKMMLNGHLTKDEIVRNPDGSIDYRSTEAAGYENAATAARDVRKQSTGERVEDREEQQDKTTLRELADPEKRTASPVLEREFKAAEERQRARQKARAKVVPPTPSPIPSRTPAPSEAAGSPAPGRVSAASLLPRR